MKTKKLWLLFAIIATVYYSCGKEETKTEEDPHNKDLRKKSLSEIKATIKGSWEIKRGCDIGFTGSHCGPWQPGDIVSFLSNDTLKRIVNGITKWYSQATIAKVRDWSTGNATDSLFSYSFQPNGTFLWTMQEIKNDTLIIDDGYAAGGGFNYYLIKK